MPPCKMAGSNEQTREVSDVRSVQAQLHALPGGVRRGDGFAVAPVGAGAGRRARGLGRPPGARRIRHPQRLRHDHGCRARRHSGRRGARAQRRDRRGRPRGERARRAEHRRDRHDRAAGADRNALAHVEHAVPQLRRRRAGARLFSDGGALRRGDDAGRHVPGGAPVRRRGDPFGHDHGARLVSQHPQPRVRRARHPGAPRRRHPRPLLLRLVAGPGRQGPPQPARHRGAPPRLEESLQRRLDHPRPRLAGQVPRRPAARERLPHRARGGARHGDPGHRPHPEPQEPAQPDRGARQGEFARQGHPAGARGVGHARRAQDGQGGRRRRSASPPPPTCASASGCRRSAISSPPASPAGSRSTPRR